jgi:MFS family permease
MANSFGIFQTYYASTLLPTSSPSSISWIGSIQGFLLLFVGVFCGRAFDAGHFYPVAGLGIFLSVFGMMMTSLATKYYQVFLAQGLCLGLGSGCLFTPGISVVGTYFSTRRGLATGIAASGSSVGKLAYSINPTGACVANKWCARWNYLPSSHSSTDCHRGLPLGCARYGLHYVSYSATWNLPPKTSTPSTKVRPGG